MADEINNVPENKEKESAGSLGIVASFLFPLVGVIIYFSNKDKVGNAFVYLIAAGLGFAISIILNMAAMS